MGFEISAVFFKESIYVIAFTLFSMQEDKTKYLQLLLPLNFEITSLWSVKNMQNYNFLLHILVAARLSNVFKPKEEKETLFQKRTLQRQRRFLPHWERLVQRNDYIFSMSSRNAIILESILY